MLAREPAREAAGRSPWLAPWFWPLLCLAIAIGALLFSFSDVVAATVATWSTSPSFEYGFLIVPVAAALAWSRRHALAQISPGVSFWGLLPVAAAAVLAAVGQAASVLAIQQIALVMLAQTLVLVLLGPAITRRLLFPLGYLYFAVPLGDLLAPVLRDVTALLSVKLLSALGATATLDGFLIRLPTADYRVAEACGGLRFFLVGLAASVLAAGLFLYSWPRRVMFLALAVVVPIIGNAMRATGLILLAEHDMLGPNSVLAHLTYGFGFIWLMMAALLALAFLLRDRLPDHARGRELRSKPEASTRSRLAPVAAAALAVAVAIAPRVYLSAEPVDPQSRIALRPPMVSPPWRLAPPPDDGWRPTATGADGEFLQSYADDGSRIDLYVAAYQRQRDGHEAVNDTNRWASGGGWIDTSRRTTAVTVDGVPLTIHAATVRDGARRRVVWAWYWVDDSFTADPVMAKLRQVKARLFRGNPAAAIFIASVAGAESPVAAGMVLAEFVAHADPLRSMFAVAPPMQGTYQQPLK